jgi:hypothetical protein
MNKPGMSVRLKQNFTFQTGHSLAKFGTAPHADHARRNIELVSFDTTSIVFLSTPMEQSKRTSTTDCHRTIQKELGH